MADALLVGSSDDPVIRYVSDHMAGRHVTAVTLNHLDYAAMVTIYPGGVEGSCVSPDIPVLLRRWQVPARPGISAFNLNENYAHIWAAAALQASRVVNRPGPSWQANMHPRNLMARLWAEAPHLRYLIPAEWYSAPGQVSAAQESEILGALPSALPATDGIPRRIRLRKPAGWIFARTVVAGDRAWQVSRLDRRLDWLQPLSRQVADALTLGFCGITWRIAPGDRAAQVARICSQPGPNELGKLFGVVCAALADHLVS